VVELLAQQEGASPIIGNLSDISVGGCFVETGTILPAGTAVKVAFSSQDRELDMVGAIARVIPGSGLAVQFKDASREGRERMYRVLEFVQRASAFYDNRYAQTLKR